MVAFNISLHFAAILISQCVRHNTHTVHSGKASIFWSESITCPTNGMPAVSVPPRRQAKDAAAHRSGLSSSSEKSAVYWPLVCFLSVPC